MKHNKPLIQERGSLKTCREKSTREQEQTYKKEPSKSLPTEQIGRGRRVELSHLHLKLEPRHLIHCLDMCYV